MSSKHANRVTAAEHALSFFVDHEPTLGDFRADMVEALSQTPKRTSPKYLYDEAGSALFDAICDAPEYYPTRTEIGILRDVAGAIAEAAGPQAAVIEPGSGSSIKIRLLLDALDRPALYVAQDISREHLLRAAETIAEAYPDLEVGAVCGDFTQPMGLQERHFRDAHRRVIFFPGSTIGNFEPDAARSVLAAARTLARPGDLLVLGADLKKDAARLEAAYDDAAGVTAQFNLNLLTRINRELDGDLDTTAFRHRARYNDGLARVEMHIESLRDQTFHVAGRPFEMTAGETIHTENSYKFDEAGLEALGAAAGFALRRTWTDPQAFFSVSLFDAA